MAGYPFSFRRDNVGTGASGWPAGTMHPAGRHSALLSRSLSIPSTISLTCSIGLPSLRQPPPCERVENAAIECPVELFQDGYLGRVGKPSLGVVDEAAVDADPQVERRFAGWCRASCGIQMCRSSFEAELSFTTAAGIGAIQPADEPHPTRASDDERWGLREQDRWID